MCLRPASPPPLPAWPLRCAQDADQQHQRVPYPLSWCRGLEGNNLTGTIPSSWTSLPALEQVVASGNPNLCLVVPQNAHFMLCLEDNGFGYHAGCKTQPVASTSSAACAGLTTNGAGSNSSGGSSSSGGGSSSSFPVAAVAVPVAVVAVAVLGLLLWRRRRRHRAAAGALLDEESKDSPALLVRLKLELLLLPA